MHPVRIFSRNSPGHGEGTVHDANSFQAGERIEKNRGIFLRAAGRRRRDPAGTPGGSTQACLGWGYEPDLTHGAVSTIHAQSGLSQRAQAPSGILVRRRWNQRITIFDAGGLRNQSGLGNTAPPLRGFSLFSSHRVKKCFYFLVP